MRNGKTGRSIPPKVYKPPASHASSVTDDIVQVDYGALLTRVAKPEVRGMTQDMLD